VLISDAFGDVPNKLALSHPRVLNKLPDAPRVIVRIQALHNVSILGLHYSLVPVVVILLYHINEHVLLERELVIA